MKLWMHFISISCLLMVVLGYQNIQAQQNLAQEAYAIFEQSCLICHGENGSYREALIIEHTALINDGKVVPGDPDGSVFYQRLIETNPAKRMPQGQPALDPASIETIRQWILTGAPDWSDIPKPETDFITTDTVLQTIENHVISLPSRDKLFARYFTLTHLYNAGETTEALNAYRRALSKLINSLSWGREVVKPLPIDAEQTVFYIDLRDYEWDVRNDAWTQIEQAYPYKMTFDAPTQAHLREKLTTLQQEMSCEVPFVHVDWFLANASLPPLYHDILALPKTDRELEASLEVFVTENLQNAPGKRVWRAGFNNSRVSRHNRVLERHTSRYGAYWKSYDFAGSSEAQHIFTHPLDFSQDGGEIIFNLPNGLQAYLIVDKEGTRIDAAPISIVSNPAVADPTVRTGLSCIGCHTKGMQTFEDEVRAVVEQADNPPFNKERALDLYVEKTEMDDLVAEDMERFRVALEETGGVFGGIEPVQRLHEAFQAPLSAAHAAAAVGLETETFLEKIRENVGLQNSLGTLALENGTVKRDAWTSNFHDVISALNTPDSELPPVVERPERIPGAGVYIPDVNLRVAVEEALGIASGSEITLNDMARLQILGVPHDAGVRVLTGLETAISLESFGAWGNPISDITPLSGLQKLHTLDISGTRVSDLKPLANLTKLRNLFLNSNGITDISPLAGLKSLIHLNLKENSISDISSLAELTQLRKLELQRNLISDVSPLAELTQLKWLGLRHNLISDFSPLETLLESTSIISNNNPGFSGGPKIEGPWLWITIPGELDDEGRAHLSTKDLLAAASNNQVTEQEVATNGVTEGEVVGNTTWTAGRLNAEDEDNINTMLRGIGLNPPKYPAYVVYGSIKFYSPQEQNTIMFLGSDMNAKVWLNGVLIRNHGGHYFDHDYHTFFPVTVNRGKNILLVAVDNSNGEEWSGYVGFEEGTEYTLLPPSEVDIPDPNLRAVIAETLGKEDDTVPITLQEMATLTTLRASNRDIKDLTGIEFAVNLEELWISENPISDLSPLAELTNLIGLGAWETPTIADLSPLTKLPKLKWLDFGSFPAPDLSPLADIKSLRRLTFHDGGIKDISQLAGFTQLTILDIAYNSTTDLSPITKLTNLEKFVANTNGISDITPLAALTNLKHLDIHGNKISDVSPLAKLENLEMVKLYNNSISDISPLGSSPIFPNVFWLENPGSAMSGPRIEGPWTWLKLPVEHFDADWLAEASGGAVTEQQVATYSATDGQYVGDNVWKSAKIDQEGTNILEMLSLVGKEHRRKYPGKPPLIYSTIVLNSPREQKTKILEGSEDVSVKIWLNGDLVHKAVSTRSGARLYDRFSPVTLREGANVLLVAIQNLPERHYGLCSVGFDEGTEYTVAPPGVGFSFSATETTNLLTGDTFTLNLNTENITDLAGWQGDIAFDPKALEAVEVTEGSFLKAEGENTFFQGGAIDNTTGKITSLYSARISESGVSGTGTLLSVTFKAKVGGETYVTLENFEFSSITGNIIPAVPPNTTITVGEYPAWDVNQDGRVSIVDLVLVAKDLGSNTPANLRTDINRDGEINIQDLILVAQNFGTTADSATASPLLAIDNKERMPAIVKTWIDQAKTENDGSIAFQQGIENLQKLLESLIPEKTALLANYPNPFNPETWIPYNLAKPADVSLTIYAVNGAVVRTFALGYQNAGMYQNRNRAAYWNGTNDVGERVGSGVYYYQLQVDKMSYLRKMVILK